MFVGYVVQRYNQTQADLVDQLFNSSEKRRARAPLLLARVGKEDRPEEVIPHVSQETLAEMIHTARSRVNFFMNKFTKLGFIDYNDRLRVHGCPARLGHSSSPLDAINLLHPKLNSVTDGKPFRRSPLSSL